MLMRAVRKIGTLLKEDPTGIKLGKYIWKKSTTFPETPPHIVTLRRREQLMREGKRGEFDVECKVEMKLAATSPITRLIRYSGYYHQFTPTQKEMWDLHADIQRALRFNHPEWIYKDVLHVPMNGAVHDVPVDMRNTQFMGADTENNEFHPLYEPDILSVIEHMVPNDGNFIDIGCNWGYFPIYLAIRPGFQGKAFCFEAAQRPYDDLARVIAALGLGETIRAHHCGLGSKQDTGSLSYELFTGTARIGEECAQVAETVKIETLDSFGLPAAAVVKIDVEGMELEVLKGGAAYFQKHKPVIIFENWFDEKDPDAALAPFHQLEAWQYEFYVIQSLGHKRNEKSVTLRSAAIQIEPSQRPVLEGRINVVAVPKEKREAFLRSRNGALRLHQPHAPNGKRQ